MKGIRISAEPIALFGGTFDPIHYGHLRCADEARQKLGLKNLYLLPAGDPPHREPPRATVKQRLEMLQLAVQEFPFLLIDDRETRRSGPSYMVDTVQELRTGFKDRPLLLLIGQDTANHFHTWYHWQQIFELSHIVVLTRPGSSVQYAPEVAKQMQARSISDVKKLHESCAGAVLQLEVESIDVSSTDIKNAITSRAAVKSMLPAAIIEYIEQNRLYLTA
jgi:nicotinate-nucleotide adenylyltransferase